MQVTKVTWHKREQCVPGSLSSSPTQKPGNEATGAPNVISPYLYVEFCSFANLTEISCITKVSMLKSFQEDDTDNIQSQDKHWRLLSAVLNPVLALSIYAPKTRLECFDTMNIDILNATLSQLHTDLSLHI